MIHSLAPGQYRDTLSLADLLAGDDLAWVGQAFTFRVTGWSMFPTLRKGDVLRLLPPDGVEAGDLVLFRHERALVCHRVIAEASDDAVRTRGDDAAGNGELVRRVDLVGKVAEVVRGGATLDPRAPPAATAIARVARSVQRALSTTGARAVESLSGLLRALLRNAFVRPAARLTLRRWVAYAVGAPAPVKLIRAYRFVELGRRPIDPGAAVAALRSLPSLREAIVLARLGGVPLGTMEVCSGEVQIRRAGTDLGIEETLRAVVRELIALEAANGR